MKMHGKPHPPAIRSTVIVLSDATVVRHWPTVKKAAMPPQEVLEVLKTR